MKENTHEKIILTLLHNKKWISNADFAAATGSPKFTSRVSDLRKKGYPIIDQWVENKNQGRHKEYALKE